MPTYEFVCVECGKTYEVTCAMSQREEARCPECGSAKKRQNYRASVFASGNAHSGSKPVHAAPSACG